MNLLTRVALPAGLLAALLTVAVTSGGAAPADRLVFVAFHHTFLGPSGHPEWLRSMMRDITSLGSTFFLTFVVAAAFFYLAAARRERLGFLLVASATLASVSSSSMKQLTSRARPDIVEPGMVEVTNSFPSGHAFLSAAILLTLAGLLARTAKTDARRIVIMSVAVITTFLVGISRIYLGVHWPSDVAAGWCLGAAWAAITLHVAKAMQQQ
jgi:undecaprenyl-diphosphatase